MKLGVGINAYNSTEFIEEIIENVRDIAAYITVGFNNVHFDGKSKAPRNVLPFLERLRANHKIDNILYIDLSDYSDTFQAERAKRNIIADDIETHGCTHQLIVDSDEVYKHDELLAIIDYINQNNITCSYIRNISYYHDKEHFIQNETTIANCITISSLRFADKNMDIIVDPTRRYNTDNYTLLPKCFRMHHFSYVSNIWQKMKHYSQRTNFPFSWRLKLRIAILLDYYFFHDGVTKVHNLIGHIITIKNIKQMDIEND